MYFLDVVLQCYKCNTTKEEQQRTELGGVAMAETTVTECDLEIRRPPFRGCYQAALLALSHEFKTSVLS